MPVGVGWSWFPLLRFPLLLMTGGVLGSAASRDWRNRFLSPLEEEYKPLWPPIRTLTPVTRFQVPPRGG